MSVKWIVITVFVLLLAGGGIYAATQGGNEESVEVETVTSETPTASDSPAAIGSTSSQAGQYLDYSEEVLAQTSGDRVLFFHAPWCPQCRSIESGIERDGVPDGWTVIKVDYDSNQELRQKYGVSLQTTFVKIDGSEGRIGDNYVAYEEPTFSAVVSNFLNK